jgi:hypothetical protein
MEEFTMADNKKTVKPKHSKFTYTTKVITGPEADANWDRAMDILAVWMARKFKADHPELFKKSQDK